MLLIIILFRNCDLCLCVFSEFDDLATDVLNECHNRDNNKAMMLAERRSPTWSNMTSMQMAASADNLVYTLMAVHIDV